MYISEKREAFGCVRVGGGIKLIRLATLRSNSWSIYIFLQNNLESETTTRKMTLGISLITRDQGGGIDDKLCARLRLAFYCVHKTPLPAPLKYPRGIRHLCLS
jgi:hypothetical protein